MMSTIIHVNRQMIAQNNKDGNNRPVLIVRQGSKKPRYCREVEIHGPSKMVYDGKPLSCGARVYLRTDAGITLIDETDFQGAKNYVSASKKKDI